MQGGQAIPNSTADQLVAGASSERAFALAGYPEVTARVDAMVAKKVVKEPEDIVYVDLLVGLDDEGLLRAVEDDEWADIEWRGRPEKIRLEFPREILPSKKNEPITRIRVAKFAA